MTPAASFAIARKHPSIAAGLVLVTLLLIIAALGPAIVHHDPNASDFVAGLGPLNMPASPSRHHWLGTDWLYRDIAARIVHGARLSLAIGIMATALSTCIGATIGIIAGYAHRSPFSVIDDVLMRIVDAGLSFPYLLLVMALGAALDRTDAFAIVIVLGATGWLGTARIVRTKTIQIRELDFIQAARALGQRPHMILLRHVLPNVATAIIITSTASVGGMILSESVLSYLSVGVAPPTATWGGMLREGQHYLIASPRLVAIPGVAILISVLGFNLLGEGLRDALDPHSS